MACRGDRLVAREAWGAAGQGDPPVAPTWVVPFVLMSMHLCIAWSKMTILSLYKSDREALEAK